MNAVWVREHWGLLVLAAIGLVGGASFWLITTPWGIGVGYDSYFYLSAADNFLSGFGLSRFGAKGAVIPLTHFPPLYPLIVAVIAIFTGNDTLLSARLAATIFYGTNILLFGWLVFRFTRSIWVGISSAVFALLAPVILDVHLLAMSEPPFFTISLLAFYLMFRYLQEGKRWMLVSAGVLSSLAYLTRYVGISLIALGFFAVIFLKRASLSARLRDTVTGAFSSFLLPILWLGRNFILTGSITNRVLAFHVPADWRLTKGINTITTWFMPMRIPYEVRSATLWIGIMGVIVLAMIWAVRVIRSGGVSAQDHPGFYFALLLLGFLVLYAAALAVSLLFFDASTSLNDRILSPVYLVGAIFVVLVVWENFPADNRIARIAGVISAALVIGYGAIVSADLAVEMRDNGMSFTGREWQHSETISGLSALAPEYLIYTNEAIPITFLTGRPALTIPQQKDLVQRIPNPNYYIELEEMADALNQSPGALVIIGSIETQNQYAPIEEMSVGLVLYRNTADGMIFIAPQFLP